MKRGQICFLACAMFFMASGFAIEKVVAQEFLWNLRLDVKFDNREFEPIKKFGTSQTFFSARLSPTVGLGFQKHHSVMLGGDFTFDMGAPLSKREPNLVLYYNYNSQKHRAVAGIFPRTKLIGAYSRAMFSGSQLFYDNNIEGVAMQYTPRDGYLELVLDWDGMQSVDRRESFRVLSAGRIDKSVFTAGYSLSLYHLASSSQALEGVVDHIMVNPWAGVAFEKIAPWFERLTLTVGWIHSFDRERRGENVWKTPHGGMIDFTIQKWKVGIRNQTYLGGSLMPFRDRTDVDGNRIYSQVYKGDPLFCTDGGIYNYTQVYWRPKLARGVNLDLQVGFHYDGYKVGWQQVAWIGVSLDNGMFGKRGKKKNR